MDFEFSEREEVFRKEVRAWLEANVPDELRGKAFASSRADVDEVRRLRGWQKTMWEAGYVGMNWPREFGGRGAPLTEQIILFQEMARAESPQFVNRGGLSMLGPTLMKYGTPAQQARHLQKILTADELWCQGFSEPNAGSEGEPRGQAARGLGGGHHHAGLRARSADVHPPHRAAQRVAPLRAAGARARPRRRSAGAPEGGRALDRRAGAADERLSKPDQDPARRRAGARGLDVQARSEEHTSELQSPCNLVCRLLLEKKKTKKIYVVLSLYRLE